MRKYKFTFRIVSGMWLVPGRSNSLWYKNSCCPSYTANNMPANAMATLGVSASAGMVLKLQTGIFRIQHQKTFMVREGGNNAFYIV